MYSTAAPARRDGSTCSCVPAWPTALPPEELLALSPRVTFPVNYVLLTSLKRKRRADTVTEGTVEVLSELSRENVLEGRRRPDVCTLQIHLTPARRPRVSSFASGIFTLREHRCCRLLQGDMRCSYKCLPQSLAHGSLNGNLTKLNQDSFAGS